MKNVITKEVIKGSFQTLGNFLKKMFDPPNKNRKRVLVFKYYEELSTSESPPGKDKLLEPAPQSIDSEGLK